MILRNPQLLWLLLLLPSILLLWRWRGVRVVGTALLLRLAAVAVVVLALTDPVLGVESAATGPLVILVDQSDSLGERGQTTLRAYAEDVVATAGRTGRVLFFGADVVASGSPGVNADPAGSDLSSALRTARALLPNGGQIWLLSDGLATSDHVLAEAQLAAEAGIRIDVMPTNAAIFPEVAISTLTLPRLLRPNEVFPIQIGVSYWPTSSRDALAARLRLWQGRQLLGEQEVRIEPGSANSFTFHHTAGMPGVIQLRAELTLTEGDTFTANNNAAATTQIVHPPQVLIVVGQPGAGNTLAAALAEEGLQSSQIEAAQLPAQLSDLAAYDGMVLVDVAAVALTLDQMSTVREFVRSEGRGLVVIGGRSTFTLGAYQDTPLAEVLPVTMEPPPRPQRSTIALLLIVDRSASMLASFGISKFDMAKEAAQLATNTLQAEDRIGILGFDTETLWVVPFQIVGGGLSIAEIQTQIANLSIGGGTSIEQALAVGLPALAQEPAEVRHAVLLTDGRSFQNDYSLYQQIVTFARSQDITLSAIAIGMDADTVLLKQLAVWGGGRYYYADQPEDIPRLTLLESDIARSDPVVEQPLRADLVQAHPIIRDFAPANLPELTGYVAVTEREKADVVLRSPAGDPLLATWQYGLGRAVAWLSSAGEPWASQWLAWPDYARFWAQLVRYTLPDPESGPLQVYLDPQPGGARLTVDATLPGGAPLDLATVQAQVTLPDGTQHSFSVRQQEPGRYTQDLSLPNPGAYVIAVTLMHNGQQQQREVGYIQPIAAEYRESSANDGLEGSALLQAIADISGGNMLDAIAITDTLPPNSSAVPTSSHDLWPWLVVLALLLWIVDIAVRRGLFVR